MGVILDVTAGNRSIWYRNRTPLGVVFIDKEHDLLYPPDIVADNTKLPIRSDLTIDSIIFDPPWGINLPPWFLNKKVNPGAGGVKYYGDFKTKRDLVIYLHKAQTEFKKYTEKLCFKWGERNVSLWSILGIFTRDGWKEIHRVKLNSIKNRGGKSKNQTWWIILKGERQEDD